ncbi:DNA ligase 4 isoform X1 [Metopolophium dirhodum]|uniref:DNA ligase 4 isoform X1 n=2 Tax=Metopolophium dirhodum TaxID=44670 RepID=UPI00298FFA0F|nr:DNA ligase 4 isoform X1 [Metopolophium dirhodum]
MLILIIFVRIMASTISKPCNKIPFELFCRVCEDIYNAKNEKKVLILEKFISKCRGSIEKSDNLNIEDTFYPALRLLLPVSDKQRGAYGVKEAALGKLYVKILCLAKDSPDAQKLLNFRMPKVSGSTAGDFAETLYWVIRSRFEDNGSMTIADINQILDEIAMKHATNESREVEQILQSMLLKLSANEQKWLIRLLLKDMRLGIAHTKILKAYHDDANDLYDVCNDLTKVCKMLNNPLVVLHEISVNLFEPFCPMLSERCEITDDSKINKTIKNEDLFVDIKLDGERFQLHWSKKKNIFKYFSRRGNDYTDTYGCNDVNGVLSPVLAKQFKSDVNNCILDGEMMCYNTKYKSFSTKAMNIDVKKLRIGNTHQPCFCVFDILYYNDRVITNLPLEKRLDILNTIFEPLEGIFVHTTRHKARKNELMKYLNDAIDNHEEGIVVKDPLSIYKPNSRNAGWYKIKPEYTDGALIELDLLIIGGYYGEGKKRGVVSHFLMGLLEKDGESFKCSAISRVSSGFSTEELADLSRKLSSHWQRVYPGKMPPNIEWGKEKPDLWIEPESSVIVQVKATEIMTSNIFKSKITLRFPRIERVRYDKPWHDCLTVKEFESIIKQTEGKLYTSHSDETNSSGKIKKNRVTLTVDKKFLGPNIRDVESINNMFEDKEFCILNDSETLNKSEIEKKILEYGGRVVQNPGNDTFCVLANNIKHIRAHAIKLSGKHSIISTKWILSCFIDNEFLNWTPENVLFLSKEHQLLMDEKFDQYGDSYTELATVETLRRSMDRVELDDDLVNTEVDAFLEFQNELFNEEQCFKIFEKCQVYFDDLNLENLPVRNFHTNTVLEMLVFKFNGGTVCKNIDSNTTHVVIHSSSKNNANKYQTMKRDRNQAFEIVDENWITQKIKW